MEPNRRSWLCQSALKPALADKAISVGADIAHFDLEDSVAQNHKNNARDQLINSLRQRPDKIRTAVRTNAMSSRDGLNDLLAIVDAPKPPDIIILPKARIMTDMAIVNDVLRPRQPVDVYAVIECPRGLHEADLLGSRPEGLRGLISGTADYASQIGVPLESADLQHMQSVISTTAHRLDIQAVDSPCFDLSNLTTLKAEATKARALGFTGKIALNPAQVPLINQVFEWTSYEVEYAKHVLTRVQDLDTVAVTNSNGKLIGPPFRKMAERILEQRRREI